MYQDEKETSNGAVAHASPEQKSRLTRLAAGRARAQAAAQAKAEAETKAPAAGAVNISDADKSQ